MKKNVLSKHLLADLDQTSVFTHDEKTYLIEAGLDFFSKIQSRKSVTIDDFKATVFLAEEDVVMGNIACCSPAHKVLMNKLSALNALQFELVFRFVLEFWSDSVGDTAIMNTRFTKEQVQASLHPFNKMQQIALIELAVDCVQYLVVGIDDLVAGFSGGIFDADSSMIGGRIVNGRSEHNDLMEKYRSMDLLSRSRLALVCTSYWAHTGFQDELFGWVFDTPYPMTIHEYVRSQLVN